MALPCRKTACRTGGNCFTFTLLNEDHMLGNALQYMVMKNPDVEFCGYCITHPSESKINFQIQTRGALPAVRRSMKEYRAQREEEIFRDAI
uniref:DNA-directed RNA polymerase RBP11-like dimerisation domain-containing protein n=1 Tax=Melopsittacus undulatus TaxID=13146 RepID=A0A8C6JXP4_MELUD